MKNLQLSRWHNLRRGSRARLGFERLEDRSLLAVDVMLTGTQVAFSDDGSEPYPLSVSVNAAGQLQYNLRTIVDGALESEIDSVDLDTTQPGEQTLLAADATLITIELAGGNGGMITGIRSGAVSFTGATLLLDWQSFEADSITTFTAGGLTRTSGGFNLSATISGVQELMLIYGDGADTVLASAFAAAINVTTNGGDDVVIGTNQSDSIFTGTGNDYLDGRQGDDSLSADEPFIAGNDIIYGRGGDDFLYCGLGDDEIHGGSGFDTAAEELADGTFIVRGQRLNVDGFITRDHDLESFYVSGSEGDDLIDASQADGRCFLFGAGGDDTIIGSSQDDSLEGGEGDDSLTGRGGDDQIFGGNGNDTVDAGAGNDWVIGGTGNDNLSAGSGQDYVRGGDDDESVIEGGDDDDHLDGGAGDDDLDGEAGSDTVLGGAGNDYLSEDPDPTGLGDTLDGGNGDDLLEIYGGANTLRGGGGDDQIMAGDYGLDDIQGGGGNDFIRASLTDTVAGGAGTDTLSLATSLVSARITNSVVTLDGVARPRAGIENFTLVAYNTGPLGVVFDAGGYTAGSVSFSGSNAYDILIGSENADFLFGFGGPDELYGKGGDDVLRADTEDAIVMGGAGTDDFGFYYLFELGLPPSPTRQQILDLLFSLGIEHDIASDELLTALIS
ncbi:MAG: hypothetical protein IAF94_07375 [Pirellulaceae bacterium]|nr:hypothetical protein [Pirellulaceae bacterium]